MKKQIHKWSLLLSVFTLKHILLGSAGLSISSHATGSPAEATAQTCVLRYGEAQCIFFRNDSRIQGFWALLRICYGFWGVFSNKNLKNIRKQTKITYLFLRVPLILACFYPILIKFGWNFQLCEAFWAARESEVYAASKTGQFQTWRNYWWSGFPINCSTRNAKGSDGLIKFRTVHMRRTDPLNKTQLSQPVCWRAGLEPGLRSLEPELEPYEIYQNNRQTKTGFVPVFMFVWIRVLNLCFEPRTHGCQSMLSLIIPLQFWL